MILEAINHYLRQGDPSDREREVLKTLGVRAASHRDFHASFPPDMNRGFMRIERVASARPVVLFGQNVPSYAYNRIVISRGAEGPEGKPVPGKTLMTALISEESLAQLMLSPNRSNKRIGLTAESFLGDVLPPRQGRGRRSSSDLLNEAIGGTSDRRIAAVKELQSVVNGLQKGIGKLARQEMAGILRQIAAEGDAEFVLERHSENLQKDLVQYRVEAASAALSVSDILDDIDRTRLLGAPEPEFDITDLELARNSNPMLDCAMMMYRPEEALLCQKVMKLYIEKALQEAFPEGINYHADIDDPHGQILRKAVPWGSKRDVDTKRLEAMVSMSSTFGNPHTNRTRAIADGYGLTATSSYISGGDADLHSSFPAVGNGHFCLRFHVGLLSESFGNEDINEGHTFLELGMSPEDMMTALRGHPTGADIPCSLDRITGVSVPRPPFESEITRAISDRGDSPDYLSAKKALGATISEVREIILDGARTTADRRQLQTLVSLLDDHLSQFVTVEQDNISESADRMSREVASMARSAFALIDDHVQKKHGVSLASLAADPKQDDLTIEGK